MATTVRCRLVDQRKPVLLRADCRLNMSGCIEAGENLNKLETGCHRRSRAGDRSLDDPFGERDRTDGTKQRESHTRRRGLSGCLQIVSDTLERRDELANDVRLDAGRIDPTCVVRVVAVVPGPGTASGSENRSSQVIRP